MTSFRRVMIGLAILLLLPLAAVLVSATFAAVLGCELNEGTQVACEVLGMDIGNTLQALFVMGWVALMTLPLLLALMVLWALVEAGAYWRARRREASAASGDLSGEGRQA